MGEFLHRPGHRRLRGHIDGRAVRHGEGEDMKAGCEFCGDTGPLVLVGRCHPTAPLRAVIEDGELTLRCYIPECDRVVAQFKLAPLEKES